MSHQARKRFGQHFLVDRNIITAIARSVAREQGEGETWVEIGPGLAAITADLVAYRAQKKTVLHAVEIDRDLIRKLRVRFTSDQLIVHEGDALAFDFAQFAPPLVLIGNLPYNISTPLLIRLIALRERVVRQIFMLQKEVILRMVAGPGTKDYGRLSVMLQAYYQMDHLFDVGPECFNPPPRVDSAIVQMVPLAKTEVLDREQLELLLVNAFSQRRKMIRAYLFAWLEQQGVVDHGLTGTLRAEDVPVADWIELSNKITRFKQLHVVGNSG